MIKVTGNVHMSNTSPEDIHGAADEIHIKTCIVSYQLPDDVSSSAHQQYNIVLKSTSAHVPAILYDFCTQVFFSGQLITHPDSKPPTILVERSNWQVHRGHFPLAHKFEETHTFGTAYVVKVELCPILGCVRCVEVVDTKMNVVSLFLQCGSFKTLCVCSHLRSCDLLVVNTDWEM